MIDLTQTHDVIGEYQKLNLKKIKAKYKDPGTQYAFDVLDQKYITGYLIKLAAFRHLRDLQRQDTKYFPYHYSIKESNKLLKFARIAPNVDTGEPTKLMPWQEFIFCQLMGWRTKDNGKRFSRAIISVARGQGKTYLMAILEAFSFLIESLGKENQDYLVASINFKQTNKLFSYIKTMMKKITQIEPFKGLSKESDLSLQFDQIIQKKSNNVLRAISYESGQYDSFHFRTAIFDEIGEVKSREKISKIISGQVKVPNHQFIQISTAYPNPSVPLHQDEQMLQQAMEQDGIRDADAYLCLVWSQDDLSETLPKNYMTWAKSNPLLYLPDQAKVLLEGLTDKRDSDLTTGNVSDFQNKNLNMWLQEATNSFLKLADIEKAVIPNFDIKGREVYIGFDYSMFSDNTALAFVYPYTDSNGKQKWHLEQHSFIPWERAGSIEAKEKQDGINYRELEEQGYCTVTTQPQGLINNEQVYNWLLNYVSENNLKPIFFGYDAWGMTPAIKQMEVNTDFPLEAIRQRTSELKDPTKFLQTGFIEHKFTRLNDRIMEKALINAQIKEDKIGIQIDKAKATLKIDVDDALVDALYQGMYHFEDYGIKNDKSKEIERMTEQQVEDWFNNKESGLLGEENNDV